MGAAQILQEDILKTSQQSLGVVLLGTIFSLFVLAASIQMLNFKRERLEKKKKK